MVHFSIEDEAGAFRHAREIIKDLDELGPACLDNQNDKLCSPVCHIFLNGVRIARGINGPFYTPHQSNLLDHAPMQALRRLSDQVLDLNKAKRRSRTRQEDPPFNHPPIDSTPILSPTNHSGTADLSADQYYALHCQVMVVGEPCVMCAMALVHSRAKSLLIAIRACTRSEERHPLDSYMHGCQYENRLTGGLGGLGGPLAVQWARSMNHHYQVYLVRVRE